MTGVSMKRPCCIVQCKWTDNENGVTACVVATDSAPTWRVSQ